MLRKKVLYPSTFRVIRLEGLPTYLPNFVMVLRYVVRVAREPCVIRKDMITRHLERRRNYNINNDYKNDDDCDNDKDNNYTTNQDNGDKAAGDENADY